MSKRIVLALGGNAILTDDPTAEAQKSALRQICRFICKLVQEGNEIIITHGNGPQVGNLYLQQKAAACEKNPVMPIDTCVAMTQGSIGYWIQNVLTEELSRNQLDSQVVSVITQVEIDPNDTAFSEPTKPIGPFLTEAEAKAEMEAGNGIFREDSDRGWRKVVPSPLPLRILETDSVQRLIGKERIVVCGGGGGIPVARTAHGFSGVEAVVDKDLVAEKLAEQLDADILLILTGVDNVFVDYNKPTQKKLSLVYTDELKEYIAQGQFPAGSMLPKIQAAVRFAEGKPGRCTIITSIQQMAGISTGSGTQIIAS